MSLPASTREVPERTLEESWNRRRTMHRLRHYMKQPRDIGDRLHELDREWDLERAVQASGALLVFTGCRIAWRLGRGFLILPILVSAAMLHHAVSGGWVAGRLLRWFGYRSRAEIETERIALRVLRGDFRRAVRIRRDGARDLIDLAAHPT